MDMKYKRITQVKATKANNCNLCKNPWNIGDDIAILRDQMTERWDLICSECSTVLEQQAAEQAAARTKVSQEG